MPLRIRAINPNPRAPLNVARIRVEVPRALVGFALEMISTMASYPPQEPTPYIRTGDLGRNWRIANADIGAITVQNAVNRSGRPYAVYPQGPKRGRKGERQTAVMRRKGWQNITDESRRVWAKHLPRVIVALSAT